MRVRVAPLERVVLPPRIIGQLTRSQKFLQNPVIYTYTICVQTNPKILNVYVRNDEHFSIVHQILYADKISHHLEPSYQTVRCMI